MSDAWTQQHVETHTYKMSEWDNMTVLTLIIIAILIAFNTFGMNQIMLMYQDIKYIKASIKDMKGEKADTFTKEDQSKKQESMRNPDNKSESESESESDTKSENT